MWIQLDFVDKLNVAKYYNTWIHNAVSVFFADFGVIHSKKDGSNK